MINHIGSRLLCYQNYCTALPNMLHILLKNYRSFTFNWPLPSVQLKYHLQVTVLLEYLCICCTNYNWLYNMKASGYSIVQKFVTSLLGCLGHLSCVTVLFEHLDICTFFKIRNAPILLALCSMLLLTQFAKCFTGEINGSQNMICIGPVCTKYTCIFDHGIAEDMLIIKHYSIIMSSVQLRNKTVRLINIAWWAVCCLLHQFEGKHKVLGIGALCLSEGIHHYYG